MKWLVALATVFSLGGALPFAWYLVLATWKNLPEERRLLIVLLMLVGHAVAVVVAYFAFFWTEREL